MTVTNDGTTLSTFTYDSNGNQTVKNVGGSLTTYTYSVENKMTGITYADSSLNTFTYDGDGKRLQKQDSSGTLRLVYDPQGPTGLYDLAKETDGSNNLVAFYTQGPMLLAMRRGGNSYWYHDDALGSTSAITSANETTTSTYKYYAFGEVLTSTGTLTNPFRYVGGLGYYDDPDSGLLLLRARYYWPAAGRFVTLDPGRDGLQWYVYAGNRPVLLVDQSGLVCRPTVIEVKTWGRASGTYTNPILASVPGWPSLGWVTRSVGPNRIIRRLNVEQIIHVQPGSNALDCDFSQEVKGSAWAMTVVWQHLPPPCGDYGKENYWPDDPEWGMTSKSRESIKWADSPGFQHPTFVPNQLRGTIRVRVFEASDEKKKTLLERHWWISFAFDRNGKLMYSKFLLDTVGDGPCIEGSGGGWATW